MFQYVSVSRIDAVKFHMHSHNQKTTEQKIKMKQTERFARPPEAQGRLRSSRAVRATGKSPEPADWTAALVGSSVTFLIFLYVKEQRPFNKAGERPKFFLTTTMCYWPRLSAIDR